MKARCYVELLTPETMNLLRSTKKNMNKNKNCKNVPHLEITEVVIVHCNINNNTYYQYLGVLYTLDTFVPNNGQLLDISPKTLHF